MKTTTTSKAVRVAATLGTLLAGAGLAQAQPEQMLIPGTVRDFQNAHPDFGLSSGGGTAVTGLTDLFSGADRRPVWAGAGEQLLQDALDADSLAIAPHLYAADQDDASVLMLKTNPFVEDKATFDSWDPDLGPYDPTLSVEIPELDTVSAIPPVDAPTMSVAKVTELRFGNIEGTKTSLVTGEYWCDDFWVGNQHEMMISGDVTIRADKKFEIRNTSQILLAPGATLSIYVGGTFFVENTASLNMNTWDHTAVTVYNFGTEDMVIENSATMVGTIISPEGMVITDNTSDLYGAVIAEGLSVDSTSGFHAAGGFTWYTECFAAGDTQEAVGLADTGSIFSEASYNQWFRDVPGVNMPQFLQMFFTRKGQVYEFETSSWEPINGELYGNEGGAVNRGFTYAAHVVFDHVPCDDRYIEIETGMDAWVFIDGRLAIDLGGTTGNHYQRIQLDRLGLNTGRHDLHLYIAQRTSSAQDFRMATTVPLLVPRNVRIRQGPQHD